MFRIGVNYGYKRYTIQPKCTLPFWGRFREMAGWHIRVGEVPYQYECI
jgi:hypothetical protein